MRKRIRLASIIVFMIIVVTTIFFFIVKDYKNNTKKEVPIVYYVEITEQTTVESVDKTTEFIKKEFREWDGITLNSVIGTVEGPSGKETYYNLNMSGVIKIMKSLGYNYEYYIRKDGVKMYGPYIMCAANLDLRPRGTIVETSLGKAIVCDTGEFANENKTQLDIAVDW